MKPIEKLVKLAEEIINDLKNKKNPRVDIPVRALSNISFDSEKRILKLGNKISSRYFFNVAHSRKFMQTILIAEFCKRLLKEKVTTSIRDLYYSLKHTIGGTKENTFNETNESICPDETLLVRMDGELKQATGYEVIEFAKQNGKLIYNKNGKKRWKDVNIKVCAFDENYKIKEMDAALVMQHPPNKVKKITTSSGRTVKITNCHSIFTCENGLPVPVEVKELKEGDWVALPRKISINVNNRWINLLNLLMEKLPDKNLRNLYLKGSLDDIKEILFRIGKDELKLFAKHYKNVWSDVVATWKHLKSIPLRLIKYSNVKIDDIVHRFKIGSNAASNRFNTLIEKDKYIGAVFGFLISEGSHYKSAKHGKDRRSVSISNSSKKLMREFKENFISVFGESSLISDIRKARDGVYCLSIGSSVLSYILSVLGYKPVRAWEKEIPSFILDSPNECVESFLKWFRLGDGSCYSKKLRIMFHTTSKKLVNGLTFLLLRFGIFPRIYTDDRHKRNPNWHKVYEIRVGSREYVKKLKDITGDLQNENLDKKSLVSGDRIPGLGQVIHHARKSCGKLNESVYKKLPWYSIEGWQQTICRGTLTKVIQILSPYSQGCVQMENLLEIVNNDICWDQIIRIEEAEIPEFTLDIAVRPTQNFIGGDGLMVLHNSNPVIEDIEATLDLLREQLNLKANRKGYMVGEVMIEDAGDVIDCSRLGTGGWGIPSDVEPEIISFKKVKANYILFVEKAAVWERLNEDKFWKKHGCILITGEGMPSRGISRLLHRLKYEKNLPLYCLTDADPWGLYIYSVIKHGSINLAYLSKKVGTPDSKFIGLSIQDVEKFGISKNVTMKLTELDKKRAKELLNYEWFQKSEWQKEINEMLKKDYKLELEALSSKGIRFISEKYLPKKIKEKDFLP